MGTRHRKLEILLGNITIVGLFNNLRHEPLQTHETVPLLGNVSALRWNCLKTSESDPKQFSSDQGHSGSRYLGGLIPNDVKFRGKTYFKTVLQIWNFTFPSRSYFLGHSWSEYISKAILDPDPDPVLIRIQMRILLGSDSNFFLSFLNNTFFFHQTYPQTYKKVKF